MSALAYCSGYGDCWTLCWVSLDSITQTFSVSGHKCITKVDLPKLHWSASLYLGTFPLIWGLPWHALPWIAFQILCRPLLIRTWTSDCLWSPYNLGFPLGWAFDNSCISCSHFFIEKTTQPKPIFEPQFHIWFAPFWTLVIVSANPDEHAVRLLYYLVLVLVCNITEVVDIIGSDLRNQTENLSTPRSTCPIILCRLIPQNFWWIRAGRH